MFLCHATHLAKNTGENQNQRESKTGTSGSTVLHTPAADTDNRVDFTPISGVIPAIVSHWLGFLCMVASCV